MPKGYLFGRPSIFGLVEQQDVDVAKVRGVGSFADTDSSGNDYYDNLSNLLESYQEKNINIFSDFDKNFQFNENALKSYIRQLTESTVEDLLNDPDGHIKYTGEMIQQLIENRINMPDFKTTDRDLARHKMFENALSNVANYIPMPEIDLPVIPAHAITNLSKDIIFNEVVRTPKFNKHLYQQFVVDEVTQDEYQLDKLFYGALKDEDGNIIKPQDVANRGKGLPISNRPVALPTKGAAEGEEFNVITTLTDGTKFDKLDWDFNIKGVVVGDVGDPDADGTFDIDINNIPAGAAYKYYPLPRKLTFDTYTGSMQGDSSITITDAETGDVYKDKLIGSCDYYKATLTIASAMGVVKAVVFDGRLSNEFNNRALGVLEKTRIIEYNVPQAQRYSHHITREELDDFKVFMKADLTTRVVKMIADQQDLWEDQSVLDFYDEDWRKLSTAKAEADIFNYEGFGTTYVCGLLPPTNYSGNPITFQTEVLQWYIQSAITAMSAKAKMDTLSYVLMTYPTTARYLTKFVDWVNTPGTSLGGVKLNTTYGKGIVDGVSVRVAVSTRLPETAPYNDPDSGDIRMLPYIDIKAFPTNNEHMTYKHWKYTSYVVQSPSEAGYMSPVGGISNPGGNFLVVTSARRYGNDSLQSLAMRIYLDPKAVSELNPYEWDK